MAEYLPVRRPSGKAAIALRRRLDARSALALIRGIPSGLSLIPTRVADEQASSPMSLQPLVRAAARTYLENDPDHLTGEYRPSLVLLA